MQRTIPLNCGRSTFVPMSIRLAGCLHEYHCLIIVLKKVNSIIGLIGDPHAVQFA
jgi:hypothetical protein